MRKDGECMIAAQESERERKKTRKEKPREGEKKRGRGERKTIVREPKKTSGKG